MGIIKRIGDFADDVRTIFSPSTAIKRKYERAMYFGYEAGQQTRKDLPFPTMSSQAESINKMSRRTLAARARDLERNNPIIGSILSALKNNVIGTGITLQARSKNERYNQRIEDLWNEWVHYENCDYTQRQSLNDILNLIMKRKFIDGGILISFPLDTNRKIPLTIQLHEVDELATGDIPEHKGVYISDGVELDNGGKPIAYWITQTTPDGLTNLNPKRLKAEDVIFLWDKDRVTQYREVSRLSRSIVATKDLGDYMNTLAFQQKMLSAITVFINSDSKNTAVPIGRPMLRNAEDKRPIETVNGGTVKYLEKGQTATPVVPQGQSAEANGYITLQQRMIAADLGLSLESTARNVKEVNYSSARQNLLNDTVTYKTMRNDLIEYFLRPLFKRFVNICELKGYLDGYGYEKGNDDYYRVEWLNSNVGWIDPKKEAEANAINLANGGKSFQQFCSEQGADWRERIDNMARVQEYAEQKKVYLPFLYGNLNMQTEKASEPKDDKEDKEDKEE